MYWLIEDIEHIETICRIKHDSAYVDVIPCSHNLHPVENSVCALYFRFERDDKGYIIPINHSETINFELEEVEKVLGKKTPRGWQFPIDVETVLKIPGAISATEM